MSSNSNPSYGDSWEEQAFAEDAAGSLGGCIWPPRSYSCSFCRREFRSAQALGGHMNVHRKDRARLKESSSPQNNEIQYHHKPIENPFTTSSLAHNNNNNLYPSPVCGLVYQTNPNSHHDFIASPSSPNYSASKGLLSSSINIGNFREETFIPFYNSSGDQRLYSRKFQPKVCIEKVSKGDGDDVDVAMRLNFIESTKKEDINCKKRKTEASSNHFFPKRSSFDKHHMQVQVQVQPKIFEFNPSSIEELDLELRLGTR